MANDKNTTTKTSSDESMTRKCCLMLIDLQNEFLSPSTGRFLIHESSRPFLNNLPGLAAIFRRFKTPIYWVRAQYGHQFLPDGEQQWDAKSVQTGTHRGKIPCCEKGSIGAEFTEDIASLISSGIGSENIIVTKTWYSAFKDTNLLVELRDRDIKVIFLAGLLTNICVMATALDAVDFGFDVTVLQDCVGWRRITSHDQALETMLKYGIRVVSSSDLDTSEGISIPASDHLPRLYYVNGSIPSWRVMMALYEKEIRFNAIRLLVMSHPKETRPPDFLALNHRGKAPVFVDNIQPSGSLAHADLGAQPKIVVNESIAILHYLETYHNPSKPLLPPVSQRVSRALSLSRIQESETLHRLCEVLDAHFDAEKYGTKFDETERNQLIKGIDDELDFWEVYAEKTAFIAGDEFSLTDCAFFPLLAYMVHRGFEWRRTGVGSSNELGDNGDWPHLQAYFRRVWEHGGEKGCAQMAQPSGWERKGKANIWKGTKDNAKGRYRNSF